MSQLEALYQRVAGRYNFVSVKPVPVAGLFPPCVVEDMGITLASTGGLCVHSPVNSGRGEFTLAASGKNNDNESTAVITFANMSWTERALGWVENDDANGTLMRRMEEAEGFLQARLSRSAGAYALTLRETGCERELVIKSSKDDTTLTFRT